jgi:hypothetical protein
MYKNSTSNSQQNIQVVIIEGFDSEKKVLNTISKGGGRITIPIYLINGVQRIPKSGETWIVRREDSTNWFLEGRYSELDYGAYVGGDIVFDTDNYLHLSGKRVFLNEQPIGSPQNQEFLVTSVDQTIDLAYYPVIQSLQAFNNGLLVNPSSIIVERKSLRFRMALTLGVLVVYYQREYSE